MHVWKTVHIELSTFCKRWEECSVCGAVQSTVITDEEAHANGRPIMGPHEWATREKKKGANNPCSRKVA
jgi:hypothetical protein